MKGKNLSEFNVNNKTSKRAMFNPQEKTTLENQPSINSRNKKEIKGKKRTEIRRQN